MPENATRAAWWIATDFRASKGQPLWGPFASRDLALTMRAFIEKCNTPVTYCVDTWPEEALDA